MLGAALVSATAAATVATGGAAAGVAAVGTIVVGPAAVAIGALIVAETTAFSAAVGLGAQKAAASIGHMLPDQIYIKVDGQKVWPTNSASEDMNTGDYRDVKCRQARLVQTIEIWERDVILADDLLLQYQLPPDIEVVRFPLVAINDELGSSYIIFLTATEK